MSDEEKGLTWRQLRFIRTLERGEKNLAQLLTELKVDPEIFRRWLKDELFGRRLEIAQKILQLRWRLEIWCAAPSAVRYMAVAMIDGKKADPLKFQFAREISRSGMALYRIDVRAAAEPDELLAPAPHPDWDREEGARLLEELHAEQAKADAIDQRSRRKRGNGASTPLPAAQTESQPKPEASHAH